MGSLVIFIGATGAGKSIHGNRLAYELDWIHISSGDLLRADAEASPLLTGGELTPDGVVERVVEQALVAVPAHITVLLDGFPRTVTEADWLERAELRLGRSITHVVFLDVSRAVSDERLGERGRSDDGRAALDEKWAEFTAQTKRVIERYRSDRRVSFTKIDADTPLEPTYDCIKKVFTS